MSRDVFSRWILAAAGALVASGVAGTILTYGLASGNRAAIEAGADRDREFRSEVLRRLESIESMLRRQK